MQLYRAGYLKYDKTAPAICEHNLLPVEDRFHVDIEPIREGSVVFDFAP
jgi:hypothetical protein